MKSVRITDEINCDGYDLDVTILYLIWMLMSEMVYCDDVGLHHNYRNMFTVTTLHGCQ